MTIQLDHTAAETVLDPASEAIDAIARGEIVVIVDDEDRENEGDLVAAADHADAGVINFMITHGRGLVCLALPASRAAELELPPMVPHNEDHMGTAFTVSIDGTPARGVTTGISAGEGALRPIPAPGRGTIVAHEFAHTGAVLAIMRRAFQPVASWRLARLRQEVLRR
ncbi:3,4-dihydroxy-2-butanone-4-phosphate synthase [Microbacterium arborescens]